MNSEPITSVILRRRAADAPWPPPVERVGREGDVVLVELLEGAADHHKPEGERWLIDTVGGGRVEPRSGLHVRGVLGSRSSPRYGVSGGIPAAGVRPGETVHLISVSGLLTVLDEVVPGDRDLDDQPLVLPPRAKVVGFFPAEVGWLAGGLVGSPEDGSRQSNQPTSPPAHQPTSPPANSLRNMNLRDFALVLPELAALSDQRNLWMVVGSATATGKTQAMRDLARHFAGQGTTPIGIKVAGIAGMRDLEVVRRAGAAAVYDFLDLGVGRAELDDVEGLRQRTLDLIRYVEAVHPGGLILCEVGGSVNIFQQIIAARELRPKIAGIVLCASDPIALLGMLYLLEPTGPLRQKIIAAAGPCVNNAPLRRKVWQQSGLPSLAEYLNMHK